jgi:hypothetical protein
MSGSLDARSPKSRPLGGKAAADVSAWIAEPGLWLQFD